MAKEYDVYKALATYLRVQYPNALFHFDMAGVATSFAAGAMNKAIQKRRGFPDFQLLEPRHGYVGLILEIKRNGERLKKKDGAWADQHVAEQAEWLDDLCGRRYYACFAIGFDECKQIIDKYLS